MVIMLLHKWLHKLSLPRIQIYILIYLRSLIQLTNAYIIESVIILNSNSKHDNFFLLKQEILYLTSFFDMLHLSIYNIRKVYIFSTFVLVPLCDSLRRE